MIAFSQHQSQKKIYLSKLRKGVEGLPTIVAGMTEKIAYPEKEIKTL